MRPRRFIGLDDIAATISTSPHPKYGHRVSIDIAEDAFADYTADLIAVVAERLANDVVTRYAPFIEKTIHDYLYDKEWARPLLEKQMDRVTMEYLRELFASFEQSLAKSRAMEAK